jgi:hypothetical protein
MCAAVLPVFCQTPSGQYEPGTITAVVAHQNGPEEPDHDVLRYDVSVKVGNTIYVVLYAPPHGYRGVEFAAGLQKLFLVGSDTLTFNSKLTGETKVPILRRETPPLTGTSSGERH